MRDLESVAGHYIHFPRLTWTRADKTEQLVVVSLHECPLLSDEFISVLLHLTVTLGNKIDLFSTGLLETE